MATLIGPAEGHAPRDLTVALRGSEIALSWSEDSHAVSAVIRTDRDGAVAVHRS
jgi:hypothetical protein